MGLRCPFWDSPLSVGRGFTLGIKHRCRVCPWFNSGLASSHPLGTPPRRWLGLHVFGIFWVIMHRSRVCLRFNSGLVSRLPPGTPPRRCLGLHVSGSLHWGCATHLWVGLTTLGSEPFAFPSGGEGASSMRPSLLRMEPRLCVFVNCDIRLSDPIRCILYYLGVPSLRLRSSPTCT
jgi:hypothetical protein